MSNEKREKKVEPEEPFRLFEEYFIRGPRKVKKAEKGG